MRHSEFLMFCGNSGCSESCRLAAMEVVVLIVA